MDSYFIRLITKEKTIHRLVKLATCTMVVGFMALSSVQVSASGIDIATTTANLRMRTAPSLDSDVVKTVTEGSEVRIVNAENHEWFRVEFNGSTGYMAAEFLELPSISMIASANLRLRTSPSLDAEIIRTAQEGSVVQIIGFVNNEWFRVELNGERGYMFSEFLLAQEEISPVAVQAASPIMVEDSPVVVPTVTTIIEDPPTVTPQGERVMEPTPFFVSASNLRLRAEPSTNGEIIKSVRQGNTVYVIGFANDEWKRVTFEGVTGYMFADYLFDRESVSAAEVGVNGVERLHWSYARNNVIRTGVPMQITDVRTGITYWIASFSNGNHADVEPLTAEDTATMLRAFGGQWTWTPRPVWVHVDGRTIAASINGMPHAGSTNPNNNMNGHVCLHFYGSRTHNGSVGHERDHQAAVLEAFNAAR